MGDHVKSEKITVNGMVCASCEKIITKNVKKLNGVAEIKADYSGGSCTVKYDPQKTSIEKIKSSIEEAGYECPSTDKPVSKKPWESAIILGVIALIIGAYFIFAPKFEAYMPSISQNTSIALLFIIGLLTGFHCIAMCGGFVVSYTTKNASEGKRNFMPHLKYGATKTLSYTLFGALFGLVGSFITFTPMIRGLAAAFAGLFLIIFGLNMLGYFKQLRRFRLKTPSFINKYVSSKTGGDSGPVTTGLLNGLMIACGPLQAIYLMAAASGSMYQGALYLFVFGLGTLPVLLGFGIVASALSSKLTNKILRYSGAFVLLLGLIMVNQGIILTGSGYDLNTLLSYVQTPAIGSASAQQFPAKMADGYQVIRMNVTAYGWTPDTFSLKKGVPVKWIIDGKEITGCNNAIQVPKLSLNFDIKKGEQTIEFTPGEAGTIPWSCWMGMIKGTFIVK